MNDSIPYDLSDLLERAADRIPVGPPPLDDLLVRATRHRHRRTVTVVMSSAAAVVVVLVGTALLLPLNSTPTPPVATPTPSVAAIPPRTRLVGIGHAAIAVPVSWGTNQTHCGTPLSDTVVIDVGGIEACFVPMPRDVDSVELQEGPARFDFVADQRSTIDGVEVQRQATSCASATAGVPFVGTGRAGTTRICTGTIFIPSLSVSFRAESSTDAATVDTILSWIRIVPDAVAVPGYEHANGEIPQGGARDRFTGDARAEGLGVQVTTERRSAGIPGMIIGVSPVPGTMVPPGTVVHLRVVAEPSGPGDEISVDLNSEGPTSDFHGLSDAQIRAGDIFRMKVGDSLWAVGHGSRYRSLDGALDGTSLIVDPQKSDKPYPPQWIATKPGTTKLTITIIADGQPVTIGVVTVVVR
jgi:hypothetical protein